MDESESILAQLSSQTTMEDRAGIVSQVLYDVLMKGHDKENAQLGAPHF